jgi:uncharacterized membrane protein
MSAEKFSRQVLLVSSMIWLIYGFLAGFGLWPWAVGFGLIAGLSLVAIVRLSAKIVVKLPDWTLVGYFLIAALATFILPVAAFPKYASVIIWAMFSAVTWASIVLGKPFTLQYARESSPPEHWQNPRFLRANLTISAVWGLAFVLNIILTVVALNLTDDTLLIGVVAPILTMVAASIFTTRYTKMVQAQPQTAT